MRSVASRRTKMRALVGAALLLGAAACTPPDALPGVEAPPRRPSDGLLHNPVLQQIVEAQQARDGTALLGYLDSPDAVVRARAAFALGSVQDTAAAPRLLQLLKDLDPRVRADAAFALGQLPLDSLATPLFDALKLEWDPVALRELLEAVGKRCEPAAARRLFQLGDPEWRWAVDRAMGRCLLQGVGGEEMWERLLEDLSHPDPRVREWAAYPFGRHPDPSVWQRQRLEIRRVLTRMDAGDPAAMHLLRALGRARDSFSWNLQGWWLQNGARWQTRSNAAEALGRAQTVAPLVRLLPGVDDASVHVRLQTLAGLAEHPPGPVTVDALQRRLQEHPEQVATAAAILPLLAQMGMEAVVEEWFSRPDLEEEAVALAGVAGAAALPGPRGVELLQEATRIPSPRVEAAAMGELRDRWEASRLFPEARPVFHQLFLELAASGSPRVARSAWEALEDTLLAPLGLPEGEPPPPPAARPVPVDHDVDWDRLRRLGRTPRLHLLTERGRVVVALSPEEAPLTVDAITRLAEEGRYDGVPFHRVVPNFVAQGGDVTRSGRESPAPRIRSEFTRIPYLRGVLGMASAGKDTETSQFFLTHSPQPHLDGGYTAFGWVVEGMGVLDRIAPEDQVVRAWVTPGG